MNKKFDFRKEIAGLRVEVLDLKKFIENQKSINKALLQLCVEAKNYINERKGLGK